MGSSFLRICTVGSVCFASLAVVGCGHDDGMVPPGDGGVVGMDGSGGELDCTGVANGVSCGGMATGFICLLGHCVPSTCGDGFVDTSRMEECDDGNVVSFDGCEPSTCTFTCEMAMECDDGDPCNGSESCVAATHRCQASTFVDGVPCMIDASTMGICGGGSCRPMGCGNGVVDAARGEDCDDMNAVDGDGCNNDCHFSCTMNADCLDADLCNGDETCNMGTHVCAPAATPLSCDDMQACTTDTCDAMTGCVNTLVDADMDGFATGMCTVDGMDVGGDCDDANNTRYPDAPETSCDTVDSNCNGSMSDGTAAQTCYRDSDGDGWGLMSATMMACDCPAGYVLPRPAGFDCFDGSSPSSIGASVHPLQLGWFTSSYCRTTPICLPSYDYNCDGTATQRYRSTVRCGFSFGICSGSGWDTTVPDCGTSAAWRNCFVSGRSCTAALLTTTRTQECH